MASRNCGRHQEKMGTQGHVTPHQGHRIVMSHSVVTFADHFLVPGVLWPALGQHQAPEYYDVILSVNDIKIGKPG